jgi:hypothetical protein
MESSISQPQPSQPRLRAMIEIVDGTIQIFAIADNDADEKHIMDALRPLRADFER